MQQGSNLPDFRAAQLDFTAHIRDPKRQAVPEGLEARRMKIYVDLIFNNVDNFLRSTFPVAHSLYSVAEWAALVRDYVKRHEATSPYFLEIPQEFMEFLANSRTDHKDPPWLLELIHYEWVELALDVADLEQPWSLVDPDADFFDSTWVVSPLIWSLGYNYPVHKIGPTNHRSVEPEPTLLIVFRDGEDRVRFLESDAVTSRLVELLSTDATLAAVIEQLSDEMKPLASADARERILQTLARLRASEIVLGPARVDSAQPD